MQQLNTEKRLQLVHQIRQEHTQNRQALKTRERILYGRECSTPAISLQKTSFLEQPGDTEPFDASIEPALPMRSTLGLRLLIAGILLLGYFLLTKYRIQLGGLTAEVIHREVNRYSETQINLFDFMDNITYTLNIE